MKKITTIIFTILTFGLGQTFGQTDKNGNPVFNSVSNNEKSFDDFLILSNYYTLKNNIENKQSSVFVSENPTLDQVEKAAVNLPSDFFILTKESKMVVMVMLQNSPKRQFMTIEMLTNQQSTFACNLVGDITENRANEIIEEKYDTTATIDNGKLKFNGKEFKIISSQEIEQAVSALIKKEKLNKKKPSDIMLPSRNEIRSFILTETKEGGKLDFFTEIKGKEYDGVQIKAGVFTTIQSVALYNWGRACFDIGVNTIDDAYEIFAEHKGKPVNERDKEYIKAGFYKEWE
ncbi:hypothetical protein [Paenimyroides aestuarii]|uniref:DUF4476 domain-containing protein n=1 Tax=Paenimyroides aestuarii TaxID=2968490 RepID=A0ABY5NQB2_9FLAO|nr:hypothetical protein [Paenimyroides aestuarii]UUV20754.1 hypothetical protein NPX36_10550 [Paenimyroides aestuarii]